MEIGQSLGSEGEGSKGLDREECRYGKALGHCRRDVPRSKKGEDREEAG
tara:strand:+ start:413 stop:559 length:147 start_codon:yes stop_codon:yes gene_type:complete